jgi:hypothetical protein
MKQAARKPGSLFNSEDGGDISYMPPKCLFTFNGLQGVISQKIEMSTTTAVRSSDPTNTLNLPGQSAVSVLGQTPIWLFVFWSQKCNGCRDIFPYFFMLGHLSMFGYVVYFSSDMRETIRKFEPTLRNDVCLLRRNQC